MKKIVKLLVGAGMILGLVACGSSAKDGTYTGTAQGKGGDVVVTITVKKGVITACEAKGEKETPTFADKVFDTLPDLVVKNNGISDTDAISGSTVTSKAFIEATHKAMQAAGLE